MFANRHNHFPTMPRRRLIKNFTRMFKQLSGNKFCQPWFPLLRRTLSECRKIAIWFRYQRLSTKNNRSSCVFRMQLTVFNLNFHLDCLVHKGVVSVLFLKLNFSLRSIFPQGYFYCTAEKSRIFPKRRNS